MKLKSRYVVLFLVLFVVALIVLVNVLEGFGKLKTIHLVIIGALGIVGIGLIGKNR